MTFQDKLSDIRDKILKDGTVTTRGKVLVETFSDYTVKRTLITPQIEVVEIPVDDLMRIITTLVEEENRKARVDELQKTYDTKLWNDGMGIYLAEGIAQLSTQPTKEEV